MVNGFRKLECKGTTGSSSGNSKPLEVPDTNDNDERLVELSEEKGIVIWNTYFRKKKFHKYVKVSEIIVINLSLNTNYLKKFSRWERTRRNSRRPVGPIFCSGQFETGNARVKHLQDMVDMKEVIWVGKLSNKTCHLAYKYRIVKDWRNVERRQIGDLDEEWNLWDDCEKEKEVAVKWVSEELKKMT